MADRAGDQLRADFFLPDEVKAVRGEVRQLCEQLLGPIAHDLNGAVESRTNFPRAVLQTFAKAGILGIPFARDVGGRGLEHPTLSLLVAIEEVAYFSSGIASALLDAPLILVGQTLDRASPALRQQYLPRMIRGEIVCSFATSEPAASTDLSPGAMQTVARKVDGGWRISGTKRWITNAVAADYMLVLARTGDKSQSLFLLDMHDNAVSVADPDQKMGNRPQLTSDVRFDGSFVADDHVVGEVGGGLRAALGALMLGRMGIGAVGIGMAQAAFDIASDHMRTREVFGQKLGGFQHWQMTFADHAIAIEQARSLYEKAGAMFDAGENVEMLAAMAKVAGSRLAVDVVRDAIQVSGAYGFVRTMGGTGEEKQLEAIYRDAKIGEIYEGANEIQKWIIARRFLGRQITG
ncbi:MULTISPECIES: acyl-CoA dehydrogenase family protein [Sphingobium]|uniref:acyl-CoA dehydrogenase family protein n=1 Tax=Sphingobium TaxID=165695 RepID=UPI00159C8700|nr:MULTISPECIES: acyl-CoA dehydrogenase family protein [unclassified Sphingobium]